MMAPADPWSAGMMAASSVAQAALKPASSAAAVANQIGFDNSGWAVTIGDGSSASTQKTTVPAGAAGLASLLSNPMVLLAIGVMLYMRAK